MDALPGHTRSNFKTTDSERLDVLQIMGPDTFDILRAGTLDKLPKLSTHRLGDGLSQVQGKLLKRMIEDRLGPHGHCVFSGHGLQREFEHLSERIRRTTSSDPRHRMQTMMTRESKSWLQMRPEHKVVLNKSSLGKLPTSTLIRWVHHAGMNGEASHRMAHLVSCNIDEILETFTPGSREWNAGYSLIYGDKGLAAPGNSATSLEVALNFVAECKEQNDSVNPLALFARAGHVRGDAITLIGGSLKQPLTFRPPASLSDLEDADPFKYLEGSPEDIFRLKVAAAIDGKRDFTNYTEKRLADYLFTRVLRNDTSAVSEILCREEYKSLVNAKDPSGYTLLDQAVSERHIDMVRLLLTLGADINEQDNLEGVTPLMTAALKQDEAIIDLLLEKGADPTRTDKGGYEAADCADSMGNTALGTRLRIAAIEW